jgi:hypothetical protein
VATPQGPLPPANIPWIDKPGTPSLAFRQYFLTLDAVVKQLNPLITVAVPTNANAKTAGVALGGLYTDTADPAKVYIRTV